MSTVRVCSECESPIAESSRDGFCPRCLIELALKVPDETLVLPSPRKPFRNPTGDAVGNYELIEQIGQGGMGVVYKARQRKLNRIVALKLMLSGPWATESEIKRFHTEATAAATLQHANVVAIHEVGEHEGQHFFSMDYIAGQSLADVIKRTPLSAERAARYVKIIAEAIHYAHQRGVLHRDLKPANILLDANDQPRITDFGLAKHIQVDSDLTVSGDVLGTPSYMPPEQAAGKRREIGPASDVYSLGAIFYDLLTGRPPFRADTPLDTLRQVLDTEPAPPRLLNRKVPRDLETICLKCLAKKPGERYRSAQELADDVGRFLHHEPIQARPVGRIGRLWGWSRRNPKLAGLVGAVAVIFLLLGVAGIKFRGDLEGMTFFAAEQTALLISEDLNKLKMGVEVVSKDSRLPGLIKAGNKKDLYNLLGEKNEQLNAAGLRWMNGQPFESWTLYNVQGHVLARWRTPKDPPETIFFGDRDHFQGASNNAPNPYVSKVFSSRTDAGKDEFGVSTAIMDRSGEQAGIVGVVLATVTTSTTRTLSNFQRYADIVLVGPTDPTDPPEVRRPWAIISHPAYAKGSKAIRIDHFPTNQQARLGSWYLDPAASKYPLFGGPWIPGISHVEGTHFYVVVQTRDHFIYALATAILVTALAALLFLGWRFFRNRRVALVSRSESAV